CEGCEISNVTASRHTLLPKFRPRLGRVRYNPGIAMDFDQLITFFEVAKQGSFSRAGEKVFRSQSAVSAQIRQLEQEYGDRLLDRSGKTVKLTPAGQIFYEYAERLRNLRDESLTAVAEIPQALGVLVEDLAS